MDADFFDPAISIDVYDMEFLAYGVNESICNILILFAVPIRDDRAKLSKLELQNLVFNNFIIYVFFDLDLTVVLIVGY